VAARSAAGAGRCGGACWCARIRAARARNVCEQGLGACMELSKPGTGHARQCRGLATAACGSVRRWGIGERRSDRYGELGTATPSAKRSRKDVMLTEAGIGRGVAERTDHGGAEAVPLRAPMRSGG
jgi:hypothetical protein